MRRLPHLILACLLVSILAPLDPLLAQSQSQDDSKSPVTVAVGPSGIRRHVPGKWATLAVNGMNRSEVDAEETVAVTIGEGTDHQFARRLWIPAGSTRQTWLPVQIPEELYSDQVFVPMKSIQLRESGGEEQFQSNVIGMATSDRRLLLSWDLSRTAVFFDQAENDPASFTEVEELSETVYAGRDSVTVSVQDLGLISLGRNFLPPSAKALDAIDQIVIASDLLLQDTLAVQRIRSWIQSGGRVWIMADRIGPDAVRELLGDTACYSVIDRVELNNFEIEQLAENAAAEEVENVVWSSETPVDMVRVMVDTDDVQCRVNGWPAAFWMTVGHGEVLFTTLGSRGWLQEESKEPEKQANRAYRAVSSRFFLNRIEPPRHTRELVSFLSDEIGYQIPSRASVAGLLGLHMLVILVAGVWLAKKQKLQHLAIIVPVAALVSAGGLIAIGNQKTSAVPSTIATGQIVQGIPDSSEVRVESVAAIYSQEARELGIESTAETTTSLREETASGDMRRLLFDDTGRSKWMFVNQPPGVVRHVVSESVVTLPQTWMVRGKFTPRGFEGRLSGLNVNLCEDPVVIAAAAPSLAVAADAGSPSVFVGGSDGVLLADQYVDSKLMSDVQQDRQDFLRNLITPDAPIFGRDPSLLVWTDPVDSGVTFDDDYRKRGSALASIPIRLERLPSGSDFQVPATFVRLESFAGERGTSTVFNPTTGKWLDEMNRPNESDLRCVPPRILLPCQINRATVSIKINAPSRTLEVKGFVDGQFVTLHRQENPNGLLEFEIDQPDALELDEEGGLLLSLAVSATEEERLASEAPDDPDSREKIPSRSTWQIEYVNVNLEGTTL